MKREILFKAKSSDGKGWVQGSLVTGFWLKSKDKSPVAEIIESKDFAGDCWEDIIDDYVFEVIPETVSQYTGLKDKNGEKIFEGDIVKFHYFYGGLGSNLGFEEREHEMIGYISSDEYGWILNAIEGEHFEGYTGFDPKEGDCSFLHLHEFSNGQAHEESFELTGKNIHDK